ncbi:hypothetical protein BBAD15_g1903 [Beauveria bassiana D1-5]|uniref:Uncharacterized protein n=1 Tax=Beauveria bassiana D1-5 TaxID=1245745 RepID=A0A0A2VWQ7_BEABA|nr:hypothetical protein BBAD15_g1903 [Beauveria bassiana D1-5]
MSSWKTTVLSVGSDFKRATQTGDWSKFLDKKNDPQCSQDEFKKLAQEFPEIKTVLEDSANHHQGITDEFQSVTDDLESGSADKPTAIERVRAQSEKLKAESIANIDASTERVMALIEGLAEDQQKKAAEFWEALLYGFAFSWSEVMTQVERIFEHVTEWTSQVWEQVRTSIKGSFTQVWAWLGGINWKNTTGRAT